MRSISNEGAPHHSARVRVREGKGSAPETVDAISVVGASANHSAGAACARVETFAGSPKTIRACARAGRVRSIATVLNARFVFVFGRLYTLL